MNKNETLYQQAEQSIPGGVNSPVRAFKGVGGAPIFFERAHGAYLFDTEQEGYLDYVGSWGPMIAGHNHPAITDALRKQIEKGLSFGAPTELEIIMAEKIKSLMPSIEMIRMVNSGTEATMSAIRLARGVTGRNKILKFSGCYHGHSDSLLVEAGSGVLTLGIPGCPGIPASLAEHTLTAEFNDLTRVTQLFEQFGTDIAAIIVEPIAGNMGCVLPKAEFLAGLRALCDQYQSIFIVDEVMTGFRVALGGATELYQIQPDLITLGKIIGGGLPVGAFGGKKSIMSQIAPSGPIYQAGTLSGNPLAMAAGLATLEVISQSNFHSKLKANTELLANSLKEIATRRDIPIVINQVCGMFSLFFTEQTTVHNYQEVKKCDTERFKKFFHHMLDQKIYLAPSAFEALFVSSAHQKSEIDHTLLAADHAFSLLR